MRALLITSVILIAPSPVDADTRSGLAEPTNPIARDHLTKGNKLFADKRYRQAIEQYEVGAVLEGAPVFAFALAQCYRKLGDWDAAETHYRQFLILADGQLSPKVLSGVYRLIDQVRAERAKAPQPQPLPPPVLTPTPVTLSPPALTPPQRTQTEREPWYRDHVGWGLTATGVFGLALGSYYLVTGVDLHNSANNDPSQAHQALLQSQAVTHYKIAGLAGAVGFGLAVAGVIKLAIPSEHQVQLAVNGKAVVLSGRF